MKRSIRFLRFSIVAILAVECCSAAFAQVAKQIEKTDLGEKQDSRPSTPLIRLSPIHVTEMGDGPDRGERSYTKNPSLLAGMGLLPYYWAACLSFAFCLVATGIWLAFPVGFLAAAFLLTSFPVAAATTGLVSAGAGAGAGAAATAAAADFVPPGRRTISSVLRTLNELAARYSSTPSQ
jgi:hypothetical protein